jgi:hypothetical protein
MKAYRARRGIAPLILNLGTRWKIVANLTPRPLYPRARTQVHIEYKTGWEQNRDGYFGEEKNLSFFSIICPLCT